MSKGLQLNTGQSFKKKMLSDYILNYTFTIILMQRRKRKNKKMNDFFFKMIFLVSPKWIAALCLTDKSCTVSLLNRLSDIRQVFDQSYAHAAVTIRLISSLLPPER